MRGQSIIRAAVADESPAVAANRKKAEKGVGFYTGEDGYMYCDGVKVEDIRQEVNQMLPITCRVSHILLFISIITSDGIYCTCTCLRKFTACPQFCM